MYSVPSLKNLLPCFPVRARSLHLLIDIVPLGNLFNVKAFLIASILKLCFCKRHHHIKGHETFVGMFIQASLKTTGADDGI